MGEGGVEFGGGGEFEIGDREVDHDSAGCEIRARLPVVGALTRSRNDDRAGEVDLSAVGRFDAGAGRDAAKGVGGSG